MWSRIHLIPVLQAEEDRDLVRRHLADQAREKELLGENVKVYNSDRYVFPFRGIYPLRHKAMDARQRSRLTVVSWLDTYGRRMR